MTTPYTQHVDIYDDPLDMIEQCLTSAEWGSDRVDDSCLQCAAPTRWGECGGMFMWREQPRAVHFSLSVDLRAPQPRKMAVLELLALVNERLWMGHFEYWAEEGVVMFRHTLPMLDRTSPEQGEVAALIAASTEALERFLPAFNFVVWAGKSPSEAIEAALFDTAGEA